jgi:hypothetical protein
LRDAETETLHDVLFVFNEAETGQAVDRIAQGEDLVLQDEITVGGREIVNALGLADVGVENFTFAFQALVESVDLFGWEVSGSETVLLTGYFEAFLDFAGCVDSFLVRSRRDRSPDNQHL